MGRKNKRKKSSYYRKMRTNPKRLISKPTGLQVHDMNNNLTSKDRANITASASASQSGAYAPQAYPRPHRGEVWFADFGYHPGTSVQEGCRPAFVISNDLGNEHSATVTVVPMTSKMKKAYLPTHVVLQPTDIRFGGPNAKPCSSNAKPCGQDAKHYDLGAKSHDSSANSRDSSAKSHDSSANSRDSSANSRNSSAIGAAYNSSDNFEPSMVLAEQLTTIGKGALKNYVGVVAESKAQEIERAVKTHLDLI